MAISPTSICNAALGRIGAKRINDYGDASETNTEAINCRLHYEMTRDALLRGHFWRFASARATLSQDTTDPDFEWENQFILPNDFLRLKSVYDDNQTPGNKTRYSYAIEGKRLLTDESTCQIRYIRQVTAEAEFDPLFVELFVLSLALKMVGPLAGGDPKLQDVLQRELALIMSKVRALDRQETEAIGRADMNTWVDVRQTHGGRIDSRLGSP